MEAFDNVLQACAQSRQPRAVRRVWELLQWCRDGGRQVPGRPRRPRDDLRPTRKTFEALLSAYAAAGDVDAALQTFHALQQSEFGVEIVHVNGVLKSIATATQRHVHGTDEDELLTKDQEEEEDEEDEEEEEEDDVKELARIALAIVKQETTTTPREDDDGDALVANEATLWLLLRTLRGAASVTTAHTEDDDPNEEDAFANELSTAVRSLAVSLSPPHVVAPRRRAGDRHAALSRRRRRLL
ncbi:hypothetical protein PINS_up008151 [Pythium insidiosum]|nr:hypothetical protein PINS_up008151 [Pythium insidiosum]